MKNLLLSLALPTSLLLSAHAVANKPNSCPNVSSIQSVGLSHATIVPVEGGWAAVLMDQKYNTDDTWTFFILPEANSSKEAYTQAVKGLTSLHFVDGPVNAYADKWFCIYGTKEGYRAATMTHFDGNFKNYTAF